MKTRSPSEIIKVNQLKLPSSCNFVQQYQAAKGISQHLAVLKEFYPIPNVEVNAESLPGILGAKGIGRCEKVGNKKYNIALIGVMSHPEHEAYLLFHEYMHVWLTENKLTFSNKRYDQDIAVFLFDLKNMIDDYLIEKETRRQFGDDYQWVCGDLRDTDLIGQFQGLAHEIGTKDYFRILLLALTCKITVDLYPRLSETLSSKIGATISVPNWESIQSAFERLSMENPFAYKGCVTSIIRGLTSSAAHFDNGEIVLEKTVNVRGAIDNINQMFAQLVPLLQMAIGLRG